MRNLFI